MLEALIKELASIEDPRCEWKVDHHLLDILVIAVCAVLGEAESFDDIALYGRREEAWLASSPCRPASPRTTPSAGSSRWSTPRPSSGASSAGCGRRSGPGRTGRGRSRSTARRCAARSTSERGARPCTW